MKNWTGGEAVGPIILGALALPVPVVVEPEALGLTVEGRIGAATVVTRVPFSQKPDPELDTDDLTLTMSVQRGDPPPPTTGGVLRDWGETRTSDGETLESPISLRRLLFRVSGAETDLGQARRGVGAGLADRLCDEIFRFGNRWVDLFRSWVEVLTHQDLDHVHPRWTAHVEGAGIATFNTDGSRFGTGGIMRLDHDSPTPATADVVRTALLEAGEDRYPPLAHLLLRDARAAWYRDQSRRALLDAATATEVSLSAIADRAGLVSSRKFLTLGDLVSELEASKHITQQETTQLRTVVIGPRNKAIHEGAEPSSWDAAEACKVAQLRVWDAFPL